MSSSFLFLLFNLFIIYIKKKLLDLAFPSVTFLYKFIFNYEYIHFLKSVCKIKNIGAKSLKPARLAIFYSNSSVQLAWFAGALFLRPINQIFALLVRPGISIFFLIFRRVENPSTCGSSVKKIVAP